MRGALAVEVSDVGPPASTSSLRRRAGEQLGCIDAGARPHDQRRRRRSSPSALRPSGGVKRPEPVGPRLPSAPRATMSLTPARWRDRHRLADELQLAADGTTR
jgi:hypothetical protein